MCNSPTSAIHISLSSSSVFWTKWSSHKIALIAEIVGHKSYSKLLKGIAFFAVIHDLFLTWLGKSENTKENGP